MIKSNGGSGSVSDATFENFIGHGNAYSLDIDQYWSSQKVGEGEGVKLTDLKFLNWTGTEVNGQQRGMSPPSTDVIYLLETTQCSADV